MHSLYFILNVSIVSNCKSYKQKLVYQTFFLTYFKSTATKVLLQEYFASADQCWDRLLVVSLAGRQLLPNSHHHSKTSPYVIQWNITSYSKVTANCPSISWVFKMNATIRSMLTINLFKWRISYLFRGNKNDLGQILMFQLVLRVHIQCQTWVEF